MLIGIDETNFC